MQQEDILNQRDNETKILIAQMQANKNMEEDMSEPEYSQEAQDHLLEQIRKIDKKKKKDRERHKSDKDKARTDASLKRQQINKKPTNNK